MFAPGQRVKCVMADEWRYATGAVGEGPRFGEICKVLSVARPFFPSYPFFPAYLLLNGYTDRLPGGPHYLARLFRPLEDDQLEVLRRVAAEPPPPARVREPA